MSPSRGGETAVPPGLFLVFTRDRLWKAPRTDLIRTPLAKKTTPLSLCGAKP